MEATGFICYNCKGEIQRPDESLGTGYGLDHEGHKICYTCCGLDELLAMQETGQAMLYLTRVEDAPLTDEQKKKGYLSDRYHWEVINWPGTLRFRAQVQEHRRGHNWGLSRRDAWFSYGGYEWHGVSYGDNTEIVHVRRTKNQREGNSLISQFTAVEVCEFEGVVPVDGDIEIDQ